MAKTGFLSVLSVKEGLSSPEDREHQFPVNFAYDYLNGGIPYLSLPDLKLNDHLKSMRFFKLGLPDEKGQDEQQIQRSDNAIDLFPLAAELPWATGILSCRQNKYWSLTLETTRVFLQHFVADELTQGVFKSGQSVAEISRKELASEMEEGWVKFPIYLFPEGDEQRTRLLAAVNVFIFVFDEFWEMHDINSFAKVQDDFVARMRPGFNSGKAPKSALHYLTDQIMEETHELDRVSGNTAGREMVDLMVRFFTRSRPPKKYHDMEEFLLYRHEDAAIPYVLGCTKFALNSSVDLNSPRLTRYLRLLKDHLSVANDLGSWEKEKRAYDTGKVLYMINVVDVVMDLFKLSSYNAAVAMTQAFQLQLEVEIDAEIERMVAENALTAEEWKFVDATLHVMGGNVFVSTVTSRYGGEKTRLT